MFHIFVSVEELRSNKYFLFLFLNVFDFLDSRKIIKNVVSMENFLAIQENEFSVTKSMHPLKMQLLYNNLIFVDCLTAH